MKPRLIVSADEAKALQEGRSIGFARNQPIDLLSLVVRAVKEHKPSHPEVYVFWAFGPRSPFAVPPLAEPETKAGKKVALPKPGRPLSKEERIAQLEARVGELEKKEAK